MANGFARVTGIAAPFLRGGVLIDQIALPDAGLRDHGQAETARHGHPPARNRNAADRRMRHAFELDRYLPDGAENPDFVLNQEPYRNASILLAGKNFGIGGTRTAAAARLLDCGFRVIIAPSFGPVFHDDCVKSGLFPVTLETGLLQALAASTAAAPRLEMTVDLEQQAISRPDIGPIPFQMYPRLLERFMRGLVDEDETIPFRDEADAFRKAQELRQPWIYHLDREEPK